MSPLISAGACDSAFEYAVRIVANISCSFWGSDAMLCRFARSVCSLLISALPVPQKPLPPETFPVLDEGGGVDTAGGVEEPLDAALDEPPQAAAPSAIATAPKAMKPRTRVMCAPP